MKNEPKEITKWQKNLIGAAIQDLGKAVSEMSDYNPIEPWRVTNNVEKAQKSITEFFTIFGESEGTTLSEDENNLGYNLHVYLRKCVDTYWAGTLHEMIDQNQGSKSWTFFIKSLCKEKNVNRAIMSTVYFTRDLVGDTLYDRIILSFLEIWSENGLKTAYRECK